MGLTWRSRGAESDTTRAVAAAAQGMHDEYWTKHVDKQNTEHYDYSGLLCTW